MSEFHSKNPSDIERLQADKDRYLNSDYIDFLMPHNARFQELDSLESRYSGVEATGRNFQVNIEENEAGELTVKLIRSDGICNLNDLLPRDCRLVGGEEPTAYSRGDKRVEFPEEQLSRKGGLLVLFHEVGHVVNNDTAFADISLGQLELAEMQAKFRRRKLARQAKKQGKQFLVINLKPIEELPLDEDVAVSLLPEWFKDKFYAAHAKSERRAWAYALLMMRKLENNGFNVLSDFTDIKDIKIFVDRFLRDYEYNREFDKKFYYQKKGDYQPIYARKTDELIA